MRPHKQVPSVNRRPTVLYLVCAAAFFSLFLFYLQSSFFAGSLYSDRNSETIRVLSNFQSTVQHCVDNRGLGLTAHVVDHCKLILKYPKDTNSTWYNTQFNKFEDLEYHYDVCETILLWEQYRNMTTVLTREYLDARPGGWMDYAPLRIAQLYGSKYAKYVGLKRDFRLVVRGAARNMVPILNGSDTEVLIIKSLTHREINAVIKTIPNPVYLFQGIVLRRGAKGTGMKSIELALSMCDIIDIYGFTFDPGYTEWTRYFSKPRKGHNPLQGRAYYQLLECLGVIRIHSPMRSKRREDWADIPSKDMISQAHAAALHLRKSQTGQGGDLGQFGNCKVWGNVDPDKSGPVSRSPDMSDVRKYSNYSKWEVMPFESLRKEAQDHYNQMHGVSIYKMDGNRLDDLVCVRHSLKSEV
ncbi:sialyltransferase-like protein 5 [Cajanus cajan]|uniref:sialyltransferase-like protein 5 n=2 Tax=Cajanus cajan TaxID=3821 RepID=UPI00098D7B11|nr:sialyltransferase-like protein 5 [Cajanus cajan]